MKILSLIAGVIAAFSVNAQVEIREISGSQPVGNDISGTTFEKYVTADNSYGIPFSIKNVSGSPMTLKIMRLRLADEALWTDDLCWGATGDIFGHCYTDDDMNTNPWTSPAMYSVTLNNDSLGTLLVGVSTEGPGDEWYRYYVVQGQSSLIDSIDVHVYSSVGVNELGSESEVSVSPNPTSESFTIVVNNEDEFHALRIADLGGNEVYFSELIGEGNIDVRKLANGIYNLTFIRRDGSTVNKRVVVQH